MNPDLKVGEQVRVRRASRGYQVGDKDTVLEGPASYTADDPKSYVVAMDEDGPGRTSIIFGADDERIGLRTGEPGGRSSHRLIDLAPLRQNLSAPKS